jgi:hypothetical protein
MTIVEILLLVAKAIVCVALIVMAMIIGLLILASLSGMERRGGSVTVRIWPRLPRSE